jgi:hypothetical protein
VQGRQRNGGALCKTRPSQVSIGQVSAPERVDVIFRFYMVSTTWVAFCVGRCSGAPITQGSCINVGEKVFAAAEEHRRDREMH